MKLVDEKAKNGSFKIGDVFAYKLSNKEVKNSGLEGQYLIFRKIDDYGENKIYENPIVYIQITDDGKLPKTKEDLNKLKYVIVSNEGNVRHEYRIRLENIPKRKKNELLIYIGNFMELITPKDEYIENIKLNIWGCNLKNIEYIVDKLIRLGTNKEPIYYDINPKNISDSHIRFLMRVEYYKKVLKLNPPKDAIVKEDPLLYIALVDSLMIGGFVRNPVGFVNEEVKKETYKRIKKLKEIISCSDEENKQERIKILDEFEIRVKEYTCSLATATNFWISNNKNNNID